MTHRTDDIVFRTVHGSHLYGLAHAGSDMDSYVVKATDTRMRQRTDGVTDVVSVGWKQLLLRAAGGSHQSVEAVFSPVKEWPNPDHELRPIIEGLRVTGADAFAKYERTIKKFAFGTFKQRRHAARLTVNLIQLRRDGTCNPRLTERQLLNVNEAAEMEGAELVQFLLPGIRLDEDGSRSPLV